jgi:hypothetical protein
MAFRDSGRARLRPSLLAAWLAGRLALPESCNVVYAGRIGRSPAGLLESDQSGISSKVVRANSEEHPTWRW